MKIGIDMLPLKTSCSTRGIGRYSNNLFMELIKIDRYNKYYFFNVPKHFANDFKQDNTIIFERNPTSNDTNDLDLFIITNLLEDRDKSVLAPSQINCKKALIFYDLIPAIFWEKYVDSWSDKDRYEYFKRLSYLDDYDLIFTLSRTSKSDLIELVGIKEDKIKVIFAGIDEDFIQDKCDTNKMSLVKAKYGIKGRFVLSTIGYDFRKNINGIFNAFCDILDDISLVIVCKIEPQIEKKLRKNWGKLGLSQIRLIITDYIPKEDLIPLYDASDVFLFPSLYEGFGLPVLEAMSRGSPVVTSNVSSLPEVCECAALYVNPGNPKEIAHAVNRILTDIYLRDKLVKLGLGQYKKFAWRRVASEVLENLEYLFLCQQNTMINDRRYKIAYFSPLNPIRSGISDYSEELLPILKNSVDIDIFIDEGYFPSNKDICNLFNIYQHTLFEEMNKEKNYDLCLYQIGNSKYHAYILKYVLKYSGLMVLHDLTLFGLISFVCHKNKIFNRELFLNCVFENHGYAKYLVMKDKMDMAKPIDPYDLSINFAKIFLDQSILTLVHNDFSKRFLENQVSFCKICTTRLQGVPRDVNNEAIRFEDQNKTSKGIIVAAFGRITFTKRIDILLKAFSKLINEKNVENTKLFLVGELHDDVKQQILSIIKKERLENFTTITGYINKEEFNKYLEITDICVNLRFPTSGETSATLVKALSFGIPVITTNYAQYKEYPDSCCWKLDLGINEVEMLSEYLFKLISDENIRKTMSKSASDYAKTINGLDRTINDYIEAINYSVRLRAAQKIDQSGE